MRRLVFASILVLLISGAASANGLSEAMDTSLIFETGGDGDWFSQTNIALFDGDATQSGYIADGQRSWMQTTIPGPGTLSFYWKVSSEANYDFLEFYIDGVRQNRISGMVDWHQMIYTISDSGPHTLEWQYQKDGEVSNGSDIGRVDLVEWVEWSGETQPPVVIPLSEALDTCLNCSTGGEAAWFSQTGSKFFDGDAAKSGNVGGNQESFLQMAVDGAGKISFYWKVSSEVGFDFLEFYIDGMLQDRINGSKDWHQMAYTITEPGTHILEWRYVKDCNKNEGDDCGWLDIVEWSGNSQPPVVTTLSKASEQIIGATSANGLSEAMDTSLIFETGGDGDWFSQTNIALFDGDATQSGYIADGQRSWMQTTIPGPGTLSFYWKVSSEANYDFLEFYIDGVRQNRISGMVDWHQMIYTISDSGPHTLEWQYQKDGEVSNGSDIGRVDLVEWVEWSGETQPPVVIPLSEALDTCLNCSTGGEAAWFSQTGSKFFDGDAAKSGNVGGNQESFLQMAVDGAGTISFYWKVSSEVGFDFLEFYIDGMLQDRINGSKDWHQMVYTITEPGTHTLEWRYAKDCNKNEGDDCGWVDLVEWSGATQSPVVTALSKASDTSFNLTTGGESE